MDFEREVIEFFAPLYGFDLDDLWGIVTFSGTDGNNHGIYFGSKYLEKKTGAKINATNTAKGGQTTQWGLENVEANVNAYQ